MNLLMNADKFTKEGQIESFKVQILLSEGTYFTNKCVGKSENQLCRIFLFSSEPLWR